jgi:hypothetical protein
VANLTIDNKVYDIDKLSPEAKAKLESARFCDKKIEQLEAELAITRTARVAYLQAMAALLNDSAQVSTTEQPASEKTIKPRKAKASTKH